MTPAHPPTARTVTADQETRVRSIVERVILERTPRQARQLSVSSLATILGASVALVACRGDVWVTLADSGFSVPLPAPSDPLWLTLQRLLRRDADARELWVVGEIAWTVIPIGRLAGTTTDDTGAVLIEGDWRASIQGLEQAAREIIRRIQRRSLSRRRIGAQLHRFTRALAKAGTVEEVGAIVLRHVVKAVPSRFAAFAVPTDEDVLQIVATHGYPVELVRDVRIAPGDGVIGGVFDRRSALYVRDVTRNLGVQRRRPRYRTNSFLALPVMSGATVDGVVCVTDRLDDQPFDREDLRLLRALLAPAGLAMAAARATEQAHLFARAATIDPVSGLFNRRYFHARVEEELERSVRQQTSVALLMIDMDDFKQINDQYGHPAGDLVIRQVSEIIRRSVRLFDICTRFGGEEFAVLMPAGACPEGGRTNPGADRALPAGGRRARRRLGDRQHWARSGGEPLVAGAD